MITNYKIFKENLLKPTTSFDDKIKKTIASNKALLIENEVLTFNDSEYLTIDESWDFYLDFNLIKTKKIVGNVWLNLNHIPSWIKDIEIDGQFDCSHNKLKSLNNCPKKINDSFSCDFNNLTTLDDGPTYVGGDYWCNANDIKFTKEYVSSICKVGDKIFI